MRTSPLDCCTIHETGGTTSGLNLGGIGTGGVEIWPDGRLHEWTVSNCRPWSGAHNGPEQPQPAIMDTDFFIRVQEAGKRPVYRWLFTGNGKAVGTASHFWRHHKYFFIHSMRAVRYRALHPVAELAFEDPDLPVQVTMRAWSPFVPHVAADAAIPGCHFDITLRNTTRRKLTVSVVWQQQNLAGHACERNRQEHEAVRQGTLHAVVMRGGLDEPDNDSSGALAMWIARKPGQDITTVACNPYMQNLIWPIHTGGDLAGALMPPHLDREEINAEPAPGTPPNKGWLCARAKLKSRGETVFHFGLSWHFPTYHTRRGTAVTHVYAERFPDALAVAAHQAKEHDRLWRDSTRLSGLLLGSEDLPPSMIAALLDQNNTLTTNTQYVTGPRIGLQEGHGCCAFNTVDVDHYSSYAMATLFPELRSRILEQQTALAHPENGKIHHGLPGTIEDIPAGGGASDGYSRWDVCCQYTLQVYRDCKWAGDRERLTACFPTARRAMELIASMDFYGIGLPYIQGGITYDHWNMQGVVGYMAGVYLAALRALEDMARLLGEEETAVWAAERFAAGRAGFESKLWNGEQYLLFYGRRPKGWQPGDDVRGEHKIFDPVKPPEEFMDPADPACGSDCACHREPVYQEIGDTGMMTDLLNGDATARVMGLGPVLDPRRVRKQIRMIDEANRQDENFCLVNGSYPDDHFLDQWPFMQWQTPWTGTEYFFALQCYTIGQVRRGDRIIDLVHERHLREGMRFDHAECNNHYARPLSIWGAYAARCGIDCDGLRERLALQPPLRDGYRGALVLAAGMGRIELRCKEGKTRCSIDWQSGRLHLRELALRTRFTATAAQLRLDGKRIPCRLAAARDHAVLRTDKPMRLKPGSSLTVSLR